MMTTDRICELVVAYNASQSAEEARERRSELFTELVHAYGPAGFSIESSQQDFVVGEYTVIRAVTIREEGTALVVMIDGRR